MKKNILIFCIQITMVTLFLFGTISSSQGADDWQEMVSKVDAENPVSGIWKKSADTISVDAKSAALLMLPIQPQGEYDFRVTFTRKTGVHSIGLLFVMNGKQATFDMDAWGQHLAGFQTVDGKDMRNNGTSSPNHTLTNAKEFTVEVRVRKNGATAYINDKLVSTYKGDGSDLGLHNIWGKADGKSLGLTAYANTADFTSIQVRAVKGSTMASSGGTKKPSTSTGNPAPSTPNTGGSSSKGKQQTVLIVIANQDFFYREYADPREELEKAGFKVEVAAASQSTCRPHNNSGQPRGGGSVKPDITIAKADPSKYAALVFSGGWGSSMYQYAFKGRYTNQSYNSSQQTKEAANKLINAFVKQDKYVGGICHGVSVLAWSRVNNQSLLKGKNITAPSRPGPAMIYNGRRQQKPSRWDSEINGAKLARAGSIGNPRSSADDVVVDGKIMTAEDDKSAREFGKILARLLSQSGSNRNTTSTSRPMPAATDPPKKPTSTRNNNSNDDISKLSDEFDDSKTLRNWKRVYQTEKTNADQLQTFDISKTKRGWMTMMPYTSTWYMEYRGVLAYKEVEGDFVVTTQVNTNRRGGQGAPRSPYSLAGLMIRTPREITPRTWRPRGENYIFLSIGAATNPGRFSFEVKTTINSKSQLVVTSTSSGQAEIRIARIGKQFVLLRRTSGGKWLVHKRYSRKDMPDTLQVGFTVYTDYSTASKLQPQQQNTTVIKRGNPDLVAQFNYIHYQRPQVPTQLQGKNITNASQVSDAQLLSFLGKDID